MTSTPPGQDSTDPEKKAGKSRQTSSTKEKASRRTWTSYEAFVKVMSGHRATTCEVAAKTPEERAKARARISLELQFVFHGHRAQVFAANFLQALSVQVR